ncbi:polysaccharide deacetylase family protein [Paenibacillus sp. CC-CFT747]|nr:polysaccharide deacetylase family protein [Paenibacillus sp. CC-CFT747]
MKKTLSRLLAAAMFGLFVLSPALAESRNAPLFYDQVAVLAYHHIDETAESGVTITPDLFRRQLEYLQDKDYHFITLEDFKGFLAGGPVPANATLVTFDDGYQSFYTKAYPILKELDIPAVNFVITGDLEHPLDTRIPSLSRDQIQEMTTSPLSVTAQCHTHRLHRKSQEGTPLLLKQKTDGRLETPEEYASRIQNDTASCLRELDRIENRKHDSFAYPFGLFDKEAENNIQSAGIAFAFTTLNEMASRRCDPMQIPRINAGSPYMDPEKLHNQVLYRTSLEVPETKYVPLSRTLRQLGGFATQTESGQLQIQYKDQVYLVSPDTLTAKSGPSVIRLESPLQERNGKNYILLKDLESILGEKIVFNPNRHVYQTRQAPTVKASR